MLERWLMQAMEREWPPFILVTIGYPGDSPDAGGLLRARDLTFEGCPDYFTGHPLSRGQLAPEDGAKNFCGAAEFQSFIGEELIPEIDRRYETIVGERSYFGHSMGGAFGLFTLLTEPSLFKNYIVSSPALAYHGETASGVRYEHHEFILKLFRDLVVRGGTFDGIRLHMSVGTEEEFDPVLANWRFTSSFYRLAAFLMATRIPGLNFTAQPLRGRNHLTAWPVAFMDGISAVFAPGRRGPSGL